MSDWDNYSENLAFDPANSMPRCDIEELKAKVSKLEEKLKIAKEALEFYAGMGHINNVVACSNIENHCYCEGDIENGQKAEDALEKIKE